MKAFWRVVYLIYLIKIAVIHIVISFACLIFYPIVWIITGKSSFKAHVPILEMTEEGFKYLEDKIYG